MVTLPSEAAGDYELIRNLVAGGMNAMRINCAHDGPEEWQGMIDHLRRAEVETGLSCSILMDLGGPKIRTGRLAPGPARPPPLEPAIRAPGAVDARYLGHAQAARRLHRGRPARALAVAPASSVAGARATTAAVADTAAATRRGLDPIAPTGRT